MTPKLNSYILSSLSWPWILVSKGIQTFSAWNSFSPIFLQLNPQKTMMMCFSKKYQAYECLLPSALMNVTIQKSTMLHITIHIMVYVCIKGKVYGKLKHLNFIERLGCCFYFCIITSTARLIIKPIVNNDPLSKTM